jgi:hypothetical protein
MDLNVGSLLASMLVSSVGFVLFMYGRKMGRPPHIVFGLALLVYPYFVPGVILMLGIAVILCGLLWFLVQRGM